MSYMMPHKRMAVSYITYYNKSMHGGAIQ